VRPFNRFDLAARLRGLLSGQDAGIAGRTATRLGVGEVSLRMSLDEDDPHPTVEVVLAVIRDYGVDPTWLISGKYDPSRHRQALEDDAAISRVLLEASGKPMGTPRISLAPRQTPGAMQPETELAPTETRERTTIARDTRTRVVEGDGLRWKVREEPWPSIDRRGGTCLIFEADTVVRRVRHFSPDWYDWAEGDLYALSLGP
jgi:hypothetical protein